MDPASSSSRCHHHYQNQDRPQRLRHLDESYAQCDRYQTHEDDGLQRRDEFKQAPQEPSIRLNDSAVKACRVDPMKALS